MKVLNVNGKTLVAGLGIIVLFGMAAGCSQAEKLSWERLKETNYRMVTGRNYHKAAKAPAKQEGQAVGQVDKQAMAAGQAGQPKGQAQSMVSVELYFADDNGEYLQAEKREIAMQPGLARATVAELLKGPKNKGLSGTIPDGTRLLDINIENGLCTVDFSKELKANHWGGSTGELLTVYSVVDTLTQFPTVDQVEILVEGRKIDTLAGHMDLSAPVLRNTSIIKNDN